ncbi:hypothetical protein [Allorhodopirellula heiligendammensis]|uniref:Uncharacterized protein n=1 Tax=Allorhodopirellula heiligendammensis TaxID=2714739 RepID=A0A5C6BYA1_9BACT|nr:hypothetical protein [Allorhodopirellula heiligendammensis]TWU15834.1 hypothetical protein Poly21_30360 [Allorhodopirellula heiligendammensis]
MKLLQFYLVVGIGVCLWFSIATAYGWRAPDTGFLSGGSSGGVYGGRGYGGSWGGGK